MSQKSQTPLYKIDTDEYVDYNCKLALCHTVICGFPYLLCLPCELRNLKDFAEAVSVKLTQKQLVYSREKVKTCWRLPICDQGRIEKTIPLSQITDVILIEPAGGCPPKTLYTLQIQTAGNSGIPGSELEITGLSESDSKQLKQKLLARRSGATMIRN